MTATRLDSQVRGVCPIIGVSIGTQGVSASVRTDYDPAATAAQKLAAQAVVDAFDWSAAAQQAWEDDQRPERTDLRQQAATAIAALDAYLVIADAATAAQVRDQVKRLSQMMRRVIVRLVQLD